MGKAEKTTRRGLRGYTATQTPTQTDASPTTLPVPGPHATAPLASSRPASHGPRCTCPPCERRQQRADSKQDNRRSRRRQTAIVGDQWRISAQRQADWMVSHEENREGGRRRKMGFVQMREQWVEYLNAHGPLSVAGALQRLHDAHALRGRVVVACCLYGLSQAAVGRQEGLAQQSISRHYRAGLAFLQATIGGYQDRGDDSCNVTRPDRGTDVDRALDKGE